MNISKINTSSACLAGFLQLAVVSAISFIGFVSPSMAQTTVDVSNSCNRPDFDRTQDTGIFIWQLCGSDQWFLRTSGGGLAAGVELRVIGSLKLSEPIVSLSPFSIFDNDCLSGTSADNDCNPNNGGTTPFDSEEIYFNLRVFGSAQDGFDFELEEGTIACLSLTNTIDAPIVIGAQNIVVTSPINIDSADKTLCVGPAIVPPISYLLLDDNL